MEKGKFDDSVRDAFRKAEVSPGEDSWTNIALQMEKANGSRLKNKVIVYQLLAAASVIFAMGISLGMFLTRGSTEELAEQLALQQKVNSVQAQNLAETQAQIEALKASEADGVNQTSYIGDEANRSSLRIRRMKILRSMDRQRNRTN
jgi:hypothetical protein